MKNRMDRLAVDQRVAAPAECGWRRLGFRFLVMTLLCAGALNATRSAADIVKQWEFEAATNYITSNPLDIEFVNDKAQLRFYENNYVASTFADYLSTNVQSSGVHVGPPSFLALTRNGAMYQTDGHYESRVMDRGARINTWQAFACRIANRTLGVENVATEVSPALDGIIGLWHLNNSALDSSSYGNNGTIASGVTFSSIAKFGGFSASFPGTAGATIRSGFPGVTNAMTIHFWLRPQSSGAGLAVPLSFHNGGSLSFLVILTENFSYQNLIANSIMFYLDNTRVTCAASGLYSFRDFNAWHQFVITYDSSASQPVTIYKDGAAIAIAAQNISGTLPTCNGMWIGGRADSPAQIYKGGLDELAVFNRALSAQEVLNLYDLTAPVKLRIRSGDQPDLSASPYVGFDGTSNTYLTAATSLVPTNGFTPQHRYVQYEVFFAPSGDRSLSPQLEVASFIGDRLNLFDYTSGDFLQGSFLNNMTYYPAANEWGYIGLGKAQNGGFNTDGYYVSRVMDAGEDVVWDQISWGTAGQSLPNTTSGLLGLWPMDGNWADVSAANRQGSPTDVSYTLLAKLGTGSCRFNGTSSRVQVGSVGTMKSLSFWVNTESLDESLMSLNGGGEPHLSIAKRYVQTAGFPAGTMIYVNGSASSTRLLAGWNHVAVIVDAGVQVQDLVVGRAASDFYSGYMDDMAMLSRSLTAGEIREILENGRRAVSGRSRMQARSATSIGELLGTAFSGPGGDTNAFYGDPSGSRLSLPDTRYVQYRAFLEGDGSGTPGVTTIHLTQSGTNVDLLDTSATISQGTYVDRRTTWYGNEITPVKLSVAGPFNSAFPDDPALRGLWHMDDGNWSPGETIRDSSGQGRHGIPQGDARLSYSAKVGITCGQFDGSGDAASLKPIADLGSSDFTAMLWFNSSSTNLGPLISSYDGVAYYAVLLNSTGDMTNSTPGSICFTLDDSFRGRQTVVSVRTGLNDGRWHHVAAVRRSPYILIYVDGDRIGAASIGSGYGNVGASETLMLGKNGSASTYYEGLLDEAIFFKRALSDGEIGELASAGYQVSGSGLFTGPIVDAGQPVIWGSLSWGAHGPSGTALSPTNDTTLIGLWHLDGTAVDATGNGHAGTVSGASFQSGGVFGRCLSFSGSGSVSVPDSGSLEVTPFTVEVWVKPSVLGDLAIVDKRDASAGYAIGTDSLGRPYFWLGGTTASDILPLNMNEWAHLVGLFNGTDMRLYVNGEPRGSAMPVGALVNTANPLKFGQANVGGGTYSGLIDEVAISDRALTAEEILDHYRSYAVQLRFQARSSNNQPFTEPFVGPDGTTNTYFVEPGGSDLVGVIPTRRYFQYRGYLDTIDHKYAPTLMGTSVKQLNYSTLDPTIEPIYSDVLNFPGNLLSFDHARNSDPTLTTQVKYQLTGDSGPSNRWFFWNSTNWAEARGILQYEAQASPIGDVRTNIVSFFTQLYPKTGGALRFKAFMHSEGDQPVELDWVRVVASEGRLVITSPNGGEVGDDAWLTGAPYAITWEHSGNVAGNVRVDYSTDGGASWTPVPGATNLPATADGCPWTTPDLETDRALVRITHLSDATLKDISDGEFQLVKRFRVVQPNGGTNQVWYIGETNTIVWDAARGLAAVNIDYSGFDVWPAGVPEDDSTNPVKIVHFLTGLGGARSNLYSWVIPTTNSGLPSTTGKVRVQTPGGGFSDYSDHFFTLAGAAFIAPTYGEKVRRGQDYVLTWRSAGCGPAVTIMTRSRPTDDWGVVATNVANIDGINMYSWTITNSSSEEAMFRILSQSDARAQGFSPIFTVAAIDVLSPRGHPDPAQSERWLMGTTQTVSWVSAGASPFVNLKFSANGGLSWLTFAENYPNSGRDTNYFTWTVPTYPSAKSRVRVEDAAAPDQLWAMSPFNFHVAGVVIRWPNGPVTQEWARASAQAIRWEQDAVGDNALVELSVDGGLSWTNVAPGGGLVSLIDNATPPYAPLTPTVRGLVRITPENPAPFTNLVDVSDSFFTIAGVRVDRPVGTDRYTVGTTNVIQFIAAGTHDPDLTVDMYYSPDGVNFDTGNPIVKNLVFSEAFPGETVYRWAIDSTREPSMAARIKVVAGNYTELSAPFAMRGISFKAPVPGQVWAPGTRTIRWAHAGLSLDSVVALYLATDGVNFTERLDPDGTLLTQGSYDWNIPETQDPSTGAVLRIVITNGTDAGFGVVSLPFVLQGIKVLEPAAATAWTLGATNTIQWYAAAAGSAMDIYYSADGTNYDATPIEQVVTSHDGVNQYSWTTEMSRTPSATARIKLVSDTGIVGTSAPFAMEGIKIVRPTGRSVYARADATNLITWTAVGDNGPYRLDYYKDGVGPTLITNVTAGARQFNWSIPPEAVSSNVVIQITGSRYRNTSDRFQIVDQPTIFIVSPAGGAFWRVGQTYTIDISRGGDMDNDFTIWYVHSGDGYSVSNQIATGADISYDPEENAFRASWRTPDRPGQARIVVRHNTIGTIGAVSETFNLVGQFELRTPNGGQQLFALKPTPVIWRTIGQVPAVDLYYSITPPYRASSWVKVNASPIVNSFNTTLQPEQSSYDWAVANIPYVSTARVRVQEAAYTNRFDAGQPGPYDDSDASFIIRYYTIFWELFDAETDQKMDRLSVTDSSGWSASDISCIPPNTISHDYPWGVWNSVWYRQYFHDKVVFNWSSDNTSLGGIPVWTQRVSMTRADIEQNYQVLANFQYSAGDQTFDTRAWLQRGSTLITEPTNCVITVYDGNGDHSADVSPNPMLIAAPQRNGVFSLLWDASHMSALKMYFAKVDIQYAGASYSSGLTFTLQVQAGTELAQAIARSESNIVGRITGVSNEVAAIHTGLNSIRAGVDDLGNMMRDATNRLLAIQGEVTGVNTTVLHAAQDIVSIAGPLSNLQERVNNMSDDAASGLARILTRPTTVEYGTDFTLLFKTRRDLDNVTYSVQRGGTQLASGAMTPLVAGIYQAVLTANWGTNSYQIVCADPNGNRDSMVVDVVPPGALSGYVALTTLTNQLVAMESALKGMTNVDWNSISNVSHDVGAITSAIYSVNWGALTNISGDFGTMRTDISTLTNRISSLLESTGTNLSAEVLRVLTNTLAGVQWSSLTNVAGDLAAITGAFLRVNWDTLYNMAGDMSSITSRIGSLNWADIDDLRATVAGFTNQIAAIDWHTVESMAGDMASITGRIGSLDWADFTRLASRVDFLSTNVGTLSSVISNVNWATVESMAADMSSITQRIGSLNWDDLNRLASRVDLLATNVTGLSGVISNVNWDTVTRMAADMSSITQKIGSLNWDDFTRLAMRVDFLSTNVGALSQVISNVNWSTVESMAADMSSITGRIGSLNWADIDQLRTTVAGFTNQIAAVDWRTVESMASDMASITNRIGALNWNDIVQLQAELRGVSTNVSGLARAVSNVNWVTVESMAHDMSTITNQIGSINWNDILRLTARVDLLSTNVGGLSGVISNVNWSTVESMAADMSSITGRIGSLDWNDINQLRATVSGFTNQIARVNWSTVEAMAADMSHITNQIGNMNWNDILRLTQRVELLSTNVGGLSGAISNVNWSTVENMAADMSSITQRIGSLNWNDIDQLRATVSGFTNQIARVNWSTVESMAADMSSITNSIGGMNWNDILRLTQRVDLLSTNVGGLSGVISNVNWSTVEAMASDMASITNRIGSINWDDIVRLTGRVDSLSTNVSHLGGAISNVNWATVASMAADMASITGRIGSLNWNDINELRATVSGFTNQIAAVDWRTVENMASDMSSITNRIGSMNWDDIVQLTGRVDLLSTNVGGLSSIISNVNWATVQAMAHDMSTITNRIGAINWNDIVQLTTNVGSLTHAVTNVNWATVASMSSDMSTITQRIGNINWTDITRISTQMTSLVSVIDRVNWNAITNISGDMAAITNALGPIRWSVVEQMSTNLTAMSGRFNTVNWNALTNVSRDMATITNALGDIKWSDVLAIANDVTAVRTSTRDVNWTDIANLDTRLVNMQTTLDSSDLSGGKLVQQVVGSVETRLGKSGDRGEATVFGRLERLERSLSSVGGDAAQAAKKARSAKTEAGNISSAVATLKRAMGEGKVDEIETAVGQINSSVKTIQQQVAEIPAMIGTSAVYEQMRRTASTIEEFAASKGYKYLVNLEEVPGKGGPGGELEQVGALRRDMQEMHGSLQFMNKLMDEMRYEPVVEETIIGAP